MCFIHYCVTSSLCITWQIQLFNRHYIYLQTVPFLPVSLSISNTVKGLIAELLQQCSFTDMLRQNYQLEKCVLTSLLLMLWKCTGSKMFFCTPGLPHNGSPTGAQKVRVGEFRFHWFVCIRHWNAATMNTHNTHASEVSHNCSIWALHFNGLPSFSQ